MLSEENRAVAQRVFVGSSRTYNRSEVNDLMNAVRREERERAIAVLRPFAEAFLKLSSRWEDHEDHWPDSVAHPPTVGDLRAASDYITQAQGGET